MAGLDSPDNFLSVTIKLLNHALYAAVVLLWPGSGSAVSQVNRHVCSSMGGPIRCIPIFVGILILAAVMASPAAAATATPHKHIPTMSVEQQKLQASLEQLRGPDVGPEQVPPTAPLTAMLPSCVPKYATDLVIPPPMPVSAEPLATVGAQTQPQH